MSRSASKIVLTRDERERLEEWSLLRDPSNRHRRAHAELILSIARNKQSSTKEIAAAQGISPTTVILWRKRFTERRLSGLEETRGRKRQLPDKTVKQIVQAIHERPEPGTARWSIRRLAKNLGLPWWAVYRAINRNVPLKDRLEFYKRRWGPTTASPYQAWITQQDGAQLFESLIDCLSFVLKQRGKSRARRAWSLLRKSKKIPSGDWNEIEEWCKDATKILLTRHKRLFLKLTLKWTQKLDGP